MALNPKPDPVLCAERWRHKDQPLPPATAVVRASRPGENAHIFAFTARCDPCIRILAALSPDAAVVDVYDLGPARTSARYDADTTTH